MFRKVLSTTRLSPHLIFALCLLLSALAAAPVPAATRDAAVVSASPEAPTLTKASTALISAPTTTVVGHSTSASAGAALQALEAALDVTPIPTTTRLPILEYHYSTFHMGDDVMMTPEWFEAQMRWLHDNEFTALSSAELVAFLDGNYLPPARSVALTFDVGASHFSDYANVVIPALRRYHLRAIFFVLASKVQDDCDGERTCWPSLIEWRDEGLISVESHTLYHQDYAILTPEQIRWDAGQSKAIIEAHTGQLVLGLCYPFDDPNPAAISILRDLGYRFTVGGPTRAERSALSGDPEPFNLPRYYPYAGINTYPALVGMGGKTFEEMMMEAVAQP